MFEMLFLGFIVMLIMAVLGGVYYMYKTHESFLSSLIDIKTYIKSLRDKIENMAKVDPKP